jgi:hypothetical protein
LLHGCTPNRKVPFIDQWLRSTYHISSFSIAACQVFALYPILRLSHILDVLFRYQAMRTWTASKIADCSYEDPGKI